MLKNISQGVSKFFTNERIVVLVVFLILVWGLLAYSGSKSSRVDTFGGSSYSSPDVTGPVSTAGSATNDMKSNNGDIDSVAASANSGSLSASVGGSSHAAAPSDLLPNDQNNQWTTLNPNTNSSNGVLMPDLLQAGYHIGLDTIGQTLRNANLQLRSDPVIPRSQVGPWNQSTIEPDLGRVPLELGQGLQ